ncbi:MAG: hypothetical protein ACFFCS_29745, partial [Candidatus Hodarchaeota archaeon]
MDPGKFNRFGQAKMIFVRVSSTSSIKRMIVNRYPYNRKSNVSLVFDLPGVKHLNRISSLIHGRRSYKKDADRMIYLKFDLGFFQLAFPLEIVNIDGVVQDPSMFYNNILDFWNSFLEV